MVSLLIGIDWHKDANILILIAAALAAVSAIYRYALLPVVRGIRKTVKVASSAVESLQWVESQMKPNGGSSLRDAIDKLVLRTDVLEDRVDELGHPET